ncbi:MAG: hypothetical protein WCT46_04505 [Candidatus Gracilibacteria bacterium]|jgi:hypothetical protein
MDRSGNGQIEWTGEINTRKAIAVDAKAVEKQTLGAMDLIDEINPRDLEPIDDDDDVIQNRRRISHTIGDSMEISNETTILGRLGVLTATNKPITLLIPMITSVHSDDLGFVSPMHSTAEPELLNDHQLNIIGRIEVKDRIILYTDGNLRKYEFSPDFDIVNLVFKNRAISREANDPLDFSYMEEGTEDEHETIVVDISYGKKSFSIDRFILRVVIDMKTGEMDIKCGVEDIMVIVGEKKIKGGKVLFPVECELPEEFIEIPAIKCRKADKEAA